MNQRGRRPVGVGKQKRRGGGRGNPQCTIREGSRRPGLHSPLTLSRRWRGLQFSPPTSPQLGDRAVPSSGKRRRGGFSALTTTPFPQPGAATTTATTAVTQRRLPRTCCSRPGSGSDDAKAATTTARPPGARSPSSPSSWGKGGGDPRRPHLA